MPLTVCAGRGNVPRVRVKSIKKGKLRSMDRSLARLTERTAKMMVACLLLSSIWTVASGNYLVYPSVCIVIVTALGTSVAPPACCCAAESPPRIPRREPSGERALVALHATAPLAWGSGHVTTGCAGSILSLIYH